MGVDVLGNAPRSKAGRYFSRNYEEGDFLNIIPSGTPKRM
jgi:hypothetical protein